jgi:hypothetical protein
VIRPAGFGFKSFLGGSEEPGGNLSLATATPGRRPRHKENDMTATTSHTETAAPTSRRRIARRFGALVAGSVVAGSVLLSAAPANAATTVSLKVCGVQHSSGRAESGATLYPQFWNGAQWKYATSYNGSTSSSGCGWVVVPSGYYWRVEIYRASYLGSPYTAAQYCRSIGYTVADDAVSNYQWFAAGSGGGHNLGSYYTEYEHVDC